MKLLVAATGLALAAFGAWLLWRYVQLASSAGQLPDDVDYDDVDWLADFEDRW
jgi:hypothetical protein